MSTGYCELFNIPSTLCKKNEVKNMRIDIKTTKYDREDDKMNFYIEISSRAAGQSMSFYMWITEEKARRIAQQILNRLDQKPHIVKNED